MPRLAARFPSGAQLTESQVLYSRYQLEISLSTFPRQYYAHITKGEGAWV